MATRRYFGATWRRRPTKSGTPSLVIEQDEGGRPVGMASANADDPAAAEAHANLMAAGPEMYTTLHNLRSVLKSEALLERVGELVRPIAVPGHYRLAPGQCPPDRVAEVLRHVLAQIDRVLAKAEGR